MGLLYLGTPLSWEEAKQYADHVRHHGITQFLHTWDTVKDRTGDELLWGDEVIEDPRHFIRAHGTPRSNTWSLRLTVRRRTRNYPCLRPKHW